MGANAVAKYPDPSLDLPCSLKFIEMFGNAHPESVLERVIPVLKFRWPGPNWWKSADFTPVAEYCEILVEAGAEDKDCEALLEQSVKGGYFDTMKWLIDRGIRLKKVPICENIKAIEILLGYGWAIDEKEFQIHAIKVGHLELTKFLVARYGPLIKEQALLDVDNPDNVLKLIEYGADPALPGLPQTSVEAVVGAMPRFHLEISSFCEKFFPALRAIGNKCKPTEFPELPWPGEHVEFEFPDLVLRQRDNTDLVPSGNPEVEQGAESAEDQSVEKPGGESAEKLVEIPIESIPIDTQEILLDATGSPYDYSPLLFPDSIRILKLQPSTTSEAPLECRLINSSISHGAPYEVLSGHWGDGSQRTPIHLSSGIHFITSELESALRCVRLDTKPRFLWIQSLCINHHNIQEKNQQINMLRDIHMSSQRLLVWLGSTADSSDLLIRYIQDTTLVEAKPIPDTVFMFQPDAHRDWVMTEETTPGTRYSPTMKDAFERFCRRPWFYRAWSLPELSLCREMTVYCGDESHSPKQTNGENLFQKLVIPYPYPQETVQSQKNPWDSHKSKTVNGPAYVKWLGNLGSLSKNDLHGFTELYTNYSVFLGGWHWGRPPFAHVLKTYDPQDIVFASLALSPKITFPVNYGLGITQQFISMTRFVLEKDQKLDLLDNCGHRKKNPESPLLGPRLHLYRLHGLTQFKHALGRAGLPRNPRSEIRR
ncbi:hypothetical protein G7Y89_g10796 [Cudoniella acicularis]|uniref:Heterokaryon incompatibility domain-containing protein n=1 Tax=Cudoniella acicularis TaxID=354080 RepID=A0A8H4VYF2_9HELO|nr:hypothetical protein G7Y89_g10796 [Cudoniella acicularis]